MALNSTTTLTQEMGIFYNKVFLERLQLETAYDFLTTKKAIPANSGKVVYWTRQTAMTISTAALTEGTVPTATSMSATTVSATLAGYGDYATFSDLFSLTSIDAGLKEKVSTMGQLAAEKMDTIRLYKMFAGATTQYANQKLVNSANPLTALLSTDTLDVADLRYAVLTLKANKAPKFEAPVGSLNKGGAYRGVIGSHGYYNLLGDSTTGAFTAINIATSNEGRDAVKNSEIKRIAGIDVMESNNEYSQVSTATSYANFIAGKDAVLEADFAGGSNQVYYNAPESSVADPLSQIATLGWKIPAWDVVVANSSWIINVQAAG